MPLFTYDEFVEKNKRPDAQKGSHVFVQGSDQANTFNSLGNALSQIIKASREEDTELTASITSAEGFSAIRDKKQNLVDFRSAYNEFDTNLKWFANMQITDSEATKKAYDQTLKNTMTFVDFLLKGDNYNTFMRLAERSEPGFSDKAKSFFDTLKILNESFGAEIDIPKFEQKHAEYKVIRAQELKAAERKPFEDSGWTFAGENPDELVADSMSLQDLENSLGGRITKAKHDYDNAKLTGRGSPQYRDIETAYNELNKKLKRLVRGQMELSKKDVVTAADYENLRTSLENLKNFTKDLKEATGKYYEHKQTDGRGQWGPNNTNKNARRRIAAAQGMDTIADLIDTYVDKKLAQLNEHLEARREAKAHANDVITSSVKPITFDEWSKKFPCDTYDYVRENKPVPDEVQRIHDLAEELYGCVSKLDGYAGIMLSKEKNTEAFNFIENLNLLANHSRPANKYDEDFDKAKWEKELNDAVKAVTGFITDGDKYAKMMETLEEVDKKTNWTGTPMSTVGGMRKALDALGKMHGIGINVAALDKKVADYKAMKNAPKPEVKEQPKQEAPKQEEPNNRITYESWKKKYPISAELYDEEDYDVDYEDIKKIDEQVKDIAKCFVRCETYCYTTTGDTKKAYDKLMGYTDEIRKLTYYAELLEDDKKFTPEDWENRINNSVKGFKEFITDGDNYALLQQRAEEYGEQFPTDKIDHPTTFKNYITHMNELYNAGIDIAALDKKYEDFKAKQNALKQEEPKPEVKEEPKPEVKEEPKPEVKEEPKPEVKEEPKPVVKEEPKQEIKEEPKEEKIDDDVASLVNNRINEIRSDDRISHSGGMPEMDENYVPLENNTFSMDFTRIEAPVNEEKIEPEPEKESPAFADALKADRDAIQAAVDHKKLNRYIRGTDYEPIKHGIAKTIAANMVSSKMSPEDEGFAQEIEYQANQIKQQKAFQEMMREANVKEGGLDDLMNNVLNGNSNALKFKFLEYAKPKDNNLTNDSIKPSNPNMAMGK